MNDDIPNDVKIMVIKQELAGIKREIYRMSVSCEARKIAGYSDDENKPLVTEIERLVKLRDSFNEKLTELSH